MLRTLPGFSALVRPTVRAASTATEAASYLPPPRAKGGHMTRKTVLPGKAPYAIREQESIAMGRFDVTNLGVNKHAPVPKSAKEYFASRLVYESKIAGLRKAFSAEVRARARREQAIAIALREEIEEKKREYQKVRLAKRIEGMQRNEVNRDLQRKQLAALQEVRRAKRAAYFEAVDKRRKVWLDKLNDEAATWISQAEIDTKITADVFAMTRPWQFDQFYEKAGFRPVDNVAHDDGWESDLDKDAIDLWEPHNRDLNTGIQLEELHYEKRMPQIITEMEQFAQDYEAKHAEWFGQGADEEEESETPKLKASDIALEASEPAAATKVADPEDVDAKLAEIEEQFLTEAEKKPTRHGSKGKKK